jgi:hypothetical protein
MKLQSSRRLLSGVRSFSLVRFMRSESLMESGNAIVADQWSRGPLRIDGSFVIKSKVTRYRKSDGLKRKVYARVEPGE